MKLKTGYSDLTPAEGVDLGNQVTTNMTGKTIWTGLAALFTQLPLDIKAVVDAMAASGPGASAQLAAADDALSITLGNIADAANKTPNVTDADLASTGLPQIKQRVQLTDPPPAPQNARLRHGDMPGSVDGSVDPIPGGNIRSYEGQWTLDPVNGPWSETFTFANSRAMKFTNLARGKDTWFRFRARNDRRRPVERPGHNYGDLKVEPSTLKGSRCVIAGDGAPRRHFAALFGSRAPLASLLAHFTSRVALRSGKLEALLDLPDGINKRPNESYYTSRRCNFR